MAMFASQLAQRMNGMFASQLTFSPALLFQNGEVGAWYDPSDFSTMYQDAAGTTPVTAVGQSVGLRLDKSRGLALGAEKFSDASVIFTAPSARVSPGVYRIYSSDGSFSNIACGGATVDKFYDVSFTIDSIANVGGGIVVDWTGAPTFTTTGVKRLRIRATTTSFSIKRASSACDYQVSNISVKEIAGNHAYQPTSTSRGVLELVSGCYGIKYDGSDDDYLTPAIDFTGTDKMTVFAGVRKLSDATAAAFVELSASANTNNGAFALLTPLAAGNIVMRHRGATAFIDATAATYAAPVTAVVSATSTLGAGAVTVNVNKTPFTNTGATGGGNYGNYPLYLGRRGRASLPFNGYDFGIIVRGAQSTADEIAATERWLAAKTGVTL